MDGIEYDNINDGGVWYYYESKKAVFIFDRVIVNKDQDDAIIPVEDNFFFSDTIQ